MMLAWSSSARALSSDARKNLIGVQLRSRARGGQPHRPQTIAAHITSSRGQAAKSSNPQVFSRLRRPGKAWPHRAESAGFYYVVRAWG
eukprot:2104765-Pyramimonas_sp.AAC.1